MKALSDEEYERILEERLLRLDAEIALVDESIEAVKRGAADAKTAAVSAKIEIEGKK